MAQIMAQGDGLCEIFIEPQGPGDGSGDLGHLQSVGQSGPVVVSLRRQKHLGLML